MADENVTTNAHADEIDALKRQMEEMQKRLEELSAASALGADADSEGEKPAAPIEGESVEQADEPVEPEGEKAEEAVEVELVEAVDVPEETDVMKAVEEVNPPVVVEEAKGESDSAGAFVSSEQASAQQAPSQPCAPASSFDSQSTQGTQAPFGQAGYAAQAGQGRQEYAQPVQPQQSYAQDSYNAQSAQAAQPQNPYGGAYVGQQVPFGQSQQSYQQPQQPYGYGYSYGNQQGGYQQPIVRTKDHVAAGLLGVFLGMFGIHKFYLGYNTAGFIMLGVAIIGGLFTFGLATSVVWLIGLIEGVIYLIKNQTEFEQAYVFKKREWF